MIKLIKEVDNDINYLEVSINGETITVHNGVVGENGETEEIKLKFIENTDEVIGNFVEDKLNEGYELLDSEKLIGLYATYPYENHQLEEVLEKRQMIYDLMNDCLGRTGNGYCDQGGIGMGNVDVFNYVIDVKKALKTILEELSNNNLLDTLKITFFYYPDEDGEYVSLYPEGL